MADTGLPYALIMQKGAVRDDGIDAPVPSKPEPGGWRDVRSYSAPPVFLFEPHHPEQCNFKPDVILNIDAVWETKYAAFQVLAAQKHLWEYYGRVALNRGMQGGRNTGKPMTYGEAYMRLFPEALEVLA